MADRLRIDRVRVQAGGELIEISWAAAPELQARMLRFKATEGLVDQFQRVGTSRAVVVADGDAGPLLVVLAQWAKEVGPRRLPVGMRELLELLGGVPSSR